MAITASYLLPYTLNLYLIISKNSTLPFIIVFFLFYFYMAWSSV